MTPAFKRPKDNLDRDAAGMRTGFKVLITIRAPMSKEGYARWGHKQKRHISKSRHVWRPYSSSRAIGLPNGVPVEVMRDDKTMGDFFIDTFLLGNGEVFGVHGWNRGATKTHVKLTKQLFTITVQDAENHKFIIGRSGSLNRYYFRKKDKTKNTTR